MTEWNQAFAFNEPFPEAVAAFMSRGVVTPDEFEAMSAAMKAKAWTVAHVYAADQLQAVFEAAGAAISKGATYADFTQATREILTSAWRRETVFRTTVLSGYGAGHWEQAWAVKDLRPYVIYRDAGDGRVRPSHRLGGLVMPLAHPYVKSHWCPWEHNCRCQWLTLSAREVQEQKLTVTTSYAGLPPVNPKFQSPAMGTPYQPDYARYAPELRAHLRGAVEKGIYE